MRTGGHDTPRGANGGARRSPSLPEALRAAGINLKSHKEGRHRAACPECARSRTRDGDVALAMRLDGTGATWLCFRCNWSGGLWTCRDCGGASPSRTCPCQQARDGKDERPPRRADPSPPLPPPEPKPQGDLQAALRLYKGCRAIEADSVASRYLIARGCAVPPEEADLRWHPKLPHPCGYVGPALVALVTDAVTCTPLTVHRTWIQADGSKAAVKPCRLLWPGLPKRDGVVRLVEDAEVTLGLAIAEGIETALTAMRVFRSTWACLDAGNLAAFPVLAGIECLTIITDHDDAGTRAARACAARWLAAGVEVRPWRDSNEGADLNDFARGDAA